MRIARLHLGAFGVFTDQALEFGGPPRTFHVVFGPNAAGKSTALRAVADLLFGIPERTTDDFLHAKPDLRIGATVVAADGKALQVVRRKGRRDTLLDPDGRPVADAAFAPFLGAATRDLFESTFGLSHERLRTGANDLLRARGALGESLLEAAGGTRSVRDVLDALDQEAGELFRPRAQQPRINAAIARLADARRQARTLAVAGEDVRSLEDEMTACERKLADADAGLARLETDRQRLDRLARNLPRLAARDALLRELECLADVPDLPETARDDRLKMTTRTDELGRTLEADEEELATLERELARHDVPTPLLEAAPRIAALKDRLAVVRKGLEDLPKRVAARGTKLADAAAALARARPGLTGEGVAAPEVAKPQARRIGELGRNHAALLKSRRDAERALAEAQRDLAQAEEALAACPPARDVIRLAAVTRQASSHGDLAARVAESAGLVASRRQQAEDRAGALPGWSGPAASLARLEAPLPETVRRWKTVLDGADRAVDRAGDQVGECEKALRDVCREIADLAAAGAVPTLDSLAAARARRDAGWALVRRAYVDGRADVGDEAAAYDASRPLPEAYEASVEAADQLADRLRADADRLARYEGLGRREAELSAELEAARAALDAARAQRDRHMGEWRGLWEPLGIAPASPAEMLEWLGARERVVELLDQMREAEVAHESLVGRVRSASAALAEAIAETEEGTAGADADIAVLVADAERIVADATARAETRKQAAGRVEERRRRLRQAEHAATDAAGELEAWRRDWRTAVEPLGIAAEAVPTEVETFLELVDEAARARKEAADLEARIRAIEDDAARLGEDVARLVSDVATDLAGRKPHAALEEIAARLQGAQRADAARKEQVARCDRLQKTVATARAEMAELGRTREALVRRAGCAALEDVEEVERRAARKRELVGERARIEGDLVADGGGRALAELVAEARDAVADEVIAERAAVDDRIAGARAERDAVRERRADVRHRLDDMGRATDAAALAAQDAEAEAAAIRSDAVRWVQLRLAAAILRDFVECYRERHQSPMLARASTLFPVLTRDTFARVQTDVDEADEPILVGLAPDGRPVTLEGMSDGTRDQLYLALRLAAVEQYLEEAEPLPFVADDLLVHFDDDRARAALAVLAELSAKTQVLFFTHHRHLVDLAREVVPESALEVHQLP